MQTLICGSLAFDTIMVFPDKFKHHILPEKIHMLNVAFLVPEMRREFGGTAGNIAYNLRLLEDNPIIMASVGEDFAAYTAWLDSHQISTAHIKKIAVLDRAISFGAYPPLFQDVSCSMHNAASKKHEIASYIYGLGGRDTLQKDIEKVYKDLEDGEISNKIKYIK